MSDKKGSRKDAAELFWGFSRYTGASLLRHYGSDASLPHSIDS